MCSSRIDNELQEKLFNGIQVKKYIQKEQSEKPNLILVILHLKPTKLWYSVWEKTGSCWHILLMCYKFLPNGTKSLDNELEVALHPQGSW